MLEHRFAQTRERVETFLQQVLPQETQHPERLHQSIRYSTLSEGKRIRPLLVYATGEALGVSSSVLDIPAAAIEMIHVYSLIHDDLPAMDDDALRRGRATNHIAFDEATAILAGDALQALAFHLLSHFPHTKLNAKQRLMLIAELSEAAGVNGMVGGQAIDLGSVGKNLNETELETMHLKKTGALIRASVLMGARCSTTVKQEQLDALSHYSRCIGLAFQVQDDILDVESDTATLGKTQGADIAADKPTYPSIMGLAAAKQKLQELHEEALETLAIFDNDMQALADLSNYIVQRVK